MPNVCSLNTYLVTFLLQFDLTDHMRAQLKDITFVIQECEKCNMYVFNHSKTITINDCVISRIFLRLVKGSVFVRDCKHTKCVVMKVFLCCFYYPELAYHFKDAGLSMFNNNWSYIHHLILVSRRNNYHESEFKMVHENSEQSCLFVCFAGEYGTANTHEKRRECEEVLLVWQQQINLKEDMDVRVELHRSVDGFYCVHLCCAEPSPGRCLWREPAHTDTHRHYRQTHKTVM
uniref:RP2 activator of ARL3 GTPase n=1 Tax=Acanthochromis polyacanthus TaxID=80966 RepID=A0A3Q1ERY1_9TELE